MSSFCSSNFHFDFSLVCYSNICNRLSETNAPEHRVQTSLKRCGLKFSLRHDMSAKFPRGESRTFFSSKSIKLVGVRTVAFSISSNEQTQ